MISPSDQSPDSALPHTPDKRLPEFPSSSSSSGEVIQEMGVPEAKRRRTTDEAPATTRAQAAVSVRQPMPLAAARPLESYFNRSKNVGPSACMIRRHMIAANRGGSWSEALSGGCEEGPRTFTRLLNGLYWRPNKHAHT